MILVSMGGIADRHDFLSRLPQELGWHLVVSGADTPHCPRPGVRLLPVFSEFYHPDLVAAADALVGKAGYSTVAEAFHCGTPFGYIKRPHSPESAVLEAFIDGHLPSLAIAAESYASGQWIEKVPDLLTLPRGDQEKSNGADEVADMIGKLLS